MGVRDWIARRRYGGQTGLNEMGNNAKMTAVTVGPFLAGWLFVQIFVPEAYLDIGMMGVFGFWIAYCVLIYAYAKADASSYRAFPQAVWRFPDGGVRVFNMLIPPDGFRKICEFKDGSVGYHVNFVDKYQYQQGGMPFPYVYGGAFFKVEDVWDRAFAFRSAGEFFHKGIAIDHPACENISVYVVGWTVKEGQIEPVCLINDCSLRYDTMMENSKKVPIGKISQLEKITMLWRAGRKREMGLLQHDAYLEDTVDQLMKEGSPDLKSVVDDRMGAVRARVHTIMDTQEPLLKRVFTFRNIMKGVVIVTVLLLVGHFLFGWP